MAKTKKTEGGEKKSQKNKKQTKIAHYPCSYCEKTFSYRAGRDKHMKLHSSVKAFACDQCTHTCKTQQYLTKHIRDVHEEATKFTCKYCNRKFHFESKMKEHILIHTNERPHKCKECGKGFNSYYCLSTHILIHQNLKPYKCKFCDYACRDGSTLRKHEERHLGLINKYECGICGKTFSVKYILNQHVAEVHLNMDVRTVPCDQCDKKFKSRSILNRHIKATHNKEFATTCEICGVKISNKYNMAAHLISHVDARPYKCTFRGCTKRYKERSSLRKHALIHFPEKQHPCNVCGRRFTRLHRLMKHKEQHEIVREKNVQCDYCGVKFYNKNYLITHIRRKHSRKKRKFICDMCDFETTNKPSLVMHIKGHNSKSYQKCSICQKTYKDVNWYRQHLWQVHKITEGNGPPPDIQVKTEPLDVDALPEFELFEIEKEELLEELRSLNAENEKDNQSQKGAEIFEDTQAKENILEQNGITNDASSVDEGLERVELCAPSISNKNVIIHDNDENVINDTDVLNSVNVDDCDNPNDVINLDDVVKNVSINQNCVDGNERVISNSSGNPNEICNPDNVRNECNNVSSDGNVNANVIQSTETAASKEITNKSSKNVDRNPKDIDNVDDNVNTNENLNPHIQLTETAVSNEVMSKNVDFIPNDIAYVDNVNADGNPIESVNVITNQNLKPGVIPPAETAAFEDITNKDVNCIPNDITDNVNADGNPNDSINVDDNVNTTNQNLKAGVVASKDITNKNADCNPNDIVNGDNNVNPDRDVYPDVIQIETAPSKDVANKTSNLDFSTQSKEIDNRNMNELDMNLVGMQRKRTPVVKVKRKGSTEVYDRDRRKEIQSRRLAWNKVRPNQKYTVFRVDALPGFENRSSESRKASYSKVKEIDDYSKSSASDENVQSNKERKRSNNENNKAEDIDVFVKLPRGRPRRIRVIKENVKEFLRPKIVSKNKIQEIDKISAQRKSSKEYTDDEGTEYSQSVLSEDITRSVTQEKTQVGFEKEFDDFVLVNMLESSKKTNDKMEELDLASQSYAKDYLNNLLKETRDKREVKLLERAREEYNERMRKARDLRKEKVAIKYFDKSKGSNSKNSEFFINDDAKNNSDNVTAEVDKDKTENNNERVHTDDDSVKNLGTDSNDIATEETASIDTASINELSQEEQIREEDNTDKIQLRPIRKKKDTEQADNNLGRYKNVDESKKIKLNTHQCYVCFKLFDTKDKLLDHCKDHFEICNTTILKKCPLCDYATKSNIIRHMRLEHSIDVAIPSKSIREKPAITNGSKYFYQVDSPEIKDMDVIPSVKHLNRQAYIKIDKRHRKLKDTGIAKTKLVKKGGEWVVERITTKIDNVDDFILPQFEIDEILSINIDTSTYLGRLQKLSRLAKKNKKKMLFPCEDCEKICQSFCALKLHVRKHEANSKPFKKKVWKHKMKDLIVPTIKGADSEKKKRVFEIDAVNDKCTNDNRYKKPKPIINNHKCDPELIKFFHANIKGGDVEFWQFLKIFNKMSRENVNDFDDLVGRPEFGIHMDEPGTSSVVLSDFVDNNDVNDPNSEIANNREETSNNSKFDVKSSIKVDYSKSVNLNKVKNSKNNFKRVIRIPKKDYLKRIELKKQLRDKISKSNFTT